MGATTPGAKLPVECDFTAERAELEAVLKSRSFARSPSVAQMLKYVCERHFNGLSHEIKEYNIAVEALGRPADFDQTQDSIVRVEAHRLRKRLQEYYSGDGAARGLLISIPAGSYVPQFIRRPGEAVALTEGPSVAAAPDGVTTQVAPQCEAGEAPVVRVPRVARSPWLLRIGLALAAVVVVGAVVLSTQSARASRNGSAPPNTPLAAALVGAGKPEDEVRILAGAPASIAVDRYGNSWSADRYFQGGTVQSSSPRPIAYTQEPSLYLHRRQGSFSYNIPVKPGVYELRLYFAETVFGENNLAGGGETTRVFRIRVNGQLVQRYLDVIADAGGSNTADIKVFKDIQPSADGMVHVEFVAFNNEVPFVNGLELVASTKGAMRPIRILARDSGFTGVDNKVWSADRYFHNGMLVQRHDAVAGAADEELYRNERYGNFSYVIPVATGSHYTVTLKFCEAWFGPERPGGPGAGGRLFDVFLNGRTLLDNFDVYRETGGLHALDKTFHGVKPNVQGKLIFNFVPNRNYAMVNAIEVIDEGK